MDYEEEYSRKQEMLSKRILDTKEKIENVVLEYENLKENNSIENKEKKMNVIKRKALKLQNFLHLLKLEKKYSRIGSRETELEKTRIYDNFTNDLKEILSPKYNYCFHGCRYIYLVKSIIESGIISSNEDRLGFDESYDTGIQISVTTINTLETTINGYAGLTNSTTQPAGAIFVVTPKDESEIESSKRMIIGNVNFKSNPERLKYIITTSENKERIVKWCMENNVDFDKVLTYDEFLTHIYEKNNKKNLQN